ncbi:TIM-barrel domain-containing protein [Natrarchaeobius chitinivorans]|uniref:Alpha-xylosidase n=1 Tax=Natrarchaeobius chitinivorans TaxID=1679083 RepID=A0A3N6MF78_NATCH|nr:TIM-barrel domain-containing protein [Natrarchaeobius chitinivorans]RQG95360.1 alpha-xylosidase [Natrarchaeobius chitinivorans]
MPRASLATVNRYDCTDGVVTLECTVDHDHSAEVDKYELPESDAVVTLEFYNPSTFRFELSPTADSGAQGVDISPETVSEPTSVDLSERDGDLLVRTDELVVTIGLDEWRFAVDERDGDELLREQHTDLTAKQERRTDPLGFSLERTNRWPYRIDSTSGSFTLFPDEHIYGFGEKFTEFDKRGQLIESWITQPNGAETERSYKNVPFFVSTRGYGLLVDTVKRTTFDVGHTSSVSKEITVDDESLAFVFCHGPSFKDVLQTYTGLTGRPGSVPKWSLGIWMSRLGYQNRDELEGVADEIRSREFPCDVFNLDPPWLRPEHLCDLVWDEESFPDPEGMIDDLHDDGFKLCLWEYPYLLSQTDAFDEAYENGYLVSNSDGEPYLLTRLSWASDRGGIVDFTNPDAREWWKDKHAKLLDMGVDAFKTDFGEYLPTDAITSDGRSGSAVRNEYSLLYTGTVHEAMVEAGVDPLLWARPGWTGGQQYPVHWGGDPNTTFESMAASLRGGLSISLSGYGFWSCDIGGFHGEPSPELYVRWAQFGLLGLSHARFHGTTPREPWEYGEEAAEIVTRYARERYRLIPYLHRLSIEASETGIPVLRPLVLEFQDDRAVYGEQTQLMLGDSLLVAPVLSSTDERDVYLPPGEWVDYWTGERYDGSQTVTVDAPLETMPVFQRSETAIPTREPTQWVDETPADRVTLRTVLDADGDTDCETTVYETDPEGTAVSISSASGGDAIDVDVDGTPADFGVTIHAVADAPDEISCNGTGLERVPDDPESGQWSYDEEAETVTALF